MQFVIRQQRHQRTTRKVITANKGGQATDSCACENEIVEQVHRVAAQLCRKIDADLIIATPENPPVSGWIARVQCQLVRGEVLRSAGCCALPQILR